LRARPVLSVVEPLLKGGRLAAFCVKCAFVAAFFVVEGW
jgi:hypothetical protein